MPAGNTLGAAENAHIGNVPGRVDVGDPITRLGGWAITAALTVIFLWFGTLESISLEQQDLVGIVSNNPLTPGCTLSLASAVGRGSWADSSF